MSKIIELIRLRSTDRSTSAVRIRLIDYLQNSFTNNDSKILPKGSCDIKIPHITKIGGGLSNDVYSVTVEYTFEGAKCTTDIVLKTYLSNMEPFDAIRRKYAYQGDVYKWDREYNIIKNLSLVSFPTPEVYSIESNCDLLGYPFLLMKKEDTVKQSISDIVDVFASTLARLHNFKPNMIGFNFLKQPKDEYDYAKSWPINFTTYLNIERKHDKKLKENFKLAIRWLYSNAAKNSCPQYCLVHGDYHPGNVCLTKDSRFLVLDWDSIEIGDPALDVGYAYHFIKFFTNPNNPNEGESVAKRFLSVYEDNYKGNISSRIEFYKTVGILGTSIFYSSGLSSPVYALKYHKRKFLQLFAPFNGALILLLFPFIKWPFVARQMGAEVDLLWLNYYNEFMNQAKFKENT